MATAADHSSLSSSTKTTSTTSSSSSRKGFTRRRRSYSDSRDVSRDSGVVLHEGWAVKESGTAMFGKTNWRKRWFRLVQRGHSTTLEYYKSQKDKTPAGFVHLDITYCTHPLEDSSKLFPNCFAVGPLLEDGATRTYYISCSNRLVMQEWIAVIDAAIQGVPEQVHKRRQTVNKVFGSRYKDKLQQLKERRISESLCDQSDEESHKMELSQTDDDSTELSTVGTLLTEKLSREDLTEEEMIDELDNEESSVPVHEASLSVQERIDNYNNRIWRMQQWQSLCDKVRTVTWAHSDTKDGITIARCKFGRSSKGHAIIKIEGTLPAEPKNVYQFMRLSTKDGGKLDYLFRNEYLVEEITSGGEPYSTVIYNEFQPPLPRLTKRDIVAMKIWIPHSLTTDGKAGLVMFSIDHPDVMPPQNEYTRISVDTSGCILSPYPGNDGSVHTKMTIFVQVAFYGAMHKMLKGAYNSGLLKLGLRTTFSFIAEQLNKYIEVTNI